MEIETLTPRLVILHPVQNDLDAELNLQYPGLTVYGPNVISKVTR